MPESAERIATSGLVISVSRDSQHRFSKFSCDEITLLAGLGVAGDAHAGVPVQHRSRVAKDPTQPNLRQVHLIHAELFEELRTQGFAVEPGQLGENITTHGLDLLSLPRGTVLGLGRTAVVEVTGLRNPCQQINAFQPKLLNAVLRRDEQGTLVRKSGIMGVVWSGGSVRPGDAVTVTLPSGAHQPLEPV